MSVSLHIGDGKEKGWEDWGQDSVGYGGGTSVLLL